MLKTILPLIVILALTSCASDPPPAVKTEAVMPARINLDVLTVTVLDRTTPPLTDSPYTTNNFQPTILAALRKWASENLVAVGTTGEAIVVINDASLKSQALAHRNDMFERQQASKYLAHASMTIEVRGREGEGNVMVEASRFSTLLEKPTAIERQNAYATVFNGLMKDFGTNAAAGITSHLSPFIVTAPVLSGPAN